MLGTLCGTASQEAAGAGHILGVVGLLLPGWPAWRVLAEGTDAQRITIPGVEVRRSCALVPHISWAPQLAKQARPTAPPRSIHPSLSDCSPDTFMD